jgi:type IV secretory pathway component VirB8
MSQKNTKEKDLPDAKVLHRADEYYEEARAWYDDLYHRPLYERSYFIVITFFSAITIWLSSQVYLSMYPLKPVVPYLIESRDIVDEYPVIKPLRKWPGEDINLSLARFLVSNYVEVRENFQHDMTQLEWSFNRIRSSTAAEEFQRYRQQVNPQSSTSPFNKYGINARRKVYINKVQVNLEGEVKTARVTFRSDVVRDQQKESRNWEANIRFRFPPLMVNQQTNEVMQWNAELAQYQEMKQVAFLVEGYTVQELTAF